MISKPGHAVAHPLQVVTTRNKPKFIKMVQLLGERSVLCLQIGERDPARAEHFEKIKLIEKECVDLFADFFANSMFKNLNPDAINSFWCYSHVDRIRVGFDYDTSEGRRHAWLVLSPEEYL